MSTENPAPEAAKSAAAPRIQINDENAVTSYANFCRVTNTPEELILDFGLNPQPVGIPSSSVTITQRIIVNYYTAKRLLHAMGASVQRHEAAFGVLEVDVQKRFRPNLQAPAK